MIAPTLVSDPRRPTPWGLIVLLGLLAVALSFGAVFAALKLSPGRGAPKDEAGIVATRSPTTTDGGTAVATAVAGVQLTASATSTMTQTPRPSATAVASGTSTSGAVTTTTPPPPGTPVPTVVVAPAAVGSVPMSGKRVTSTGRNFSECSFKEQGYGEPIRRAFEAIGPAIDACFAAAALDPPVHETRDYDVSYDATGHARQVTLRSVPGNAAVPRLDACAGAAVRTVVVPPTKAPCWASVAFGAPCVFHEPGRCGKATP